MPGFKNKRMALLIIALILSGLFILSPWKSKNTGAPLPNAVKGPNWGIDITGGSRIMLRLEATQATIGLPEDTPDYSKYADNVVERFRENLEHPVTPIVKENIEETGEITIEIGKYVPENLIISLLENEESLLKIEKKVSQSTQDKVKNSLKTRVDPYGTLGAQFKPLGRNNQFLQFEVSLPLDRAKKLLGKEGLPEVFIDNYRVIWSRHIRNVQKNLLEGEWGVSFTLTDEGKERFADYTGRKQNIPDKKGHPGAIYLDRPNNAIILFEEDLIDTIKNQTAGFRIEEAEYSKSANKFKYKTPNDPTTPLDEEHWFYLQAAAVPIKDNQISQKDKNYILSLINQEEINKAIFLGKTKKLPEQLIQKGNLIIDNETLPIENTTKQEEREETTIEWFHRTVGLESWPTLQPSITSNVENLERGLRIDTGGKGEAEELRIILSQRLPVQVTHISETHLEPRLSQGFIGEAAKAWAEED